MALIDSLYWNQQSADDLVAKHPKHDLRYGTMLTVRESQEAYFFKNGVLCDKFTGGRHMLSSANLPILNKIINIPSGGDTIFLAEVWFVSKLEKRNILWGTGGMRIIDPYFQIPIKVSSRGQYGIRINDGAMFLKKLIGTLASADTTLIMNQFRADVVESVKTTIASFMKENNLNINEICTAYRSLSRSIAKNLQESFDEYGIELLNFNIENIGFDENDKGYQTVMEGIAEQARLSKLGINYLQQKQLDIAQTAAGNEGAGNIMGLGIGLSAGQQIGGIVAQNINQSGIGMAPPPPPPSPNYYVAINGQTAGPFSMAQLNEMKNAGNFNKSSLVYKVGGNAWVTAESEPALNSLFVSMTPPPPPPPVM